MIKKDKIRQDKMTLTDSLPNRFTEATAQSLCNYLTDRQLSLVRLEVTHPSITPLLESLPAERKELRAIAVMMADALYFQGKSSAIPLLRFESNCFDGGSHQGIFTIDSYDLLFPDSSCLTEDWKESDQCQTLTQDLTELVEWMLN